MGRHSAPDEDTADVAATATATLDVAAPSGRHAQSDEPPAPEDEQHTQMIAVVDPDVEADDTHVTDVIVPPEALEPPADLLPLEPEPDKPSRAERKAQKQAAKAAAAEAKAAEAKAAEAKAAEAKAAEAKAAEAAAPAPSPAPAAPPKERKPKDKKRTKNGETDTQADLRVLRENSAVRARSIAGVLVSFLLYTIVMIVIGRTEVYLLWIWIPIVVSGVLVGVVLDLAHRPPKDAVVTPPTDEPLG